jgi:hypothetical protein
MKDLWKQTVELLVLPGKHVPVLLGLLQLVHEARDVGLLLPDVALGLLVQHRQLVQLALQVAVEPLQVVYPLLQFPARPVRLKSQNKSKCELEIIYIYFELTYKPHDENIN